MNQLTIIEIVTQLNIKFIAFANQITNTPDEQFEVMPNGKWSAGQHLDHLILSVAPINQALYLPKFMLGWIIGKANRPSRTYTELVQKYQDKLAMGGVAPSQFVPKPVPLSQKQKLLKKYFNHRVQLTKHILRCSESDLDTYIAPHPLLGKITLRELMYFTIYHTEHHLNILLR